MATLLIVDDDTAIRETLAELLSSSNECHTADRAEQALAYLEVENYDVVLTDISMPGLSGREVLRAVQKNHPATPVIVISGNPNAEAGAELLAMGAFAYLTKPFKLEVVEDTVIRAIAHRQELRTASQGQNSNGESSTGQDAHAAADAPVREESS
ncbi:MAG TPA: response regulator [Pyrinomonadaceae bacterium]|nr:response regulator [Pyrinomonadaceae bacterium]